MSGYDSDYNTDTTTTETTDGGGLRNVMTSRVIDTVRDHAIPAALIGVGVWLLMRNLSADDDLYEITGTGISDDDADMTGDSGVTSRVADMAHGAGDTVRGAASSVAGSTSHLAHRVVTPARDFTTESPLIAGLAAAALGALVGVLIPESSREHQLMGAARDKMMERAREAARENLGRAKDAAQSAIRTAKDDLVSNFSSSGQSQA
jgi:ElaB/YqjD/DUF883 family membrane-anchored ribosome-binding protein